MFIEWVWVAVVGVFSANQGKQLKTEATGSVLTDFGKGCHIKTHVIFGHFFNIFEIREARPMAKNAQKPHFRKRKLFIINNNFFYNNNL